MEPLRRYFDTHDDRPANLAARLAVKPSTITRILKGERRPSIELAKRIAAETGLTLAEIRPDILGEAA